MRARALPGPIVILDNGKEFLRLTTLADMRDFLKHIPKEKHIHLHNGRSWSHA